MKAIRHNGLAVSAQWPMACRSACLWLALVLSLCAPRAPAQLFTNLPALVNQIRDPLLSGTFGPNGKFGGPKSIASADFDGDGTNDLAIANTDGSISVFFGAGGGHFSQPPQHLTNGTSSLRGILAADLNGDGKPDIAVAAPYETNGQILIYFNPGSGRFTEPARLPAWRGARALAAGDFDGDGKIDLILAGTTNGLRQYRGLGGGAFAAITNLSTLGSSISLEDPTKFPKPVYSLKTFRPAGMTKDLLAITHAATNRVWVAGADSNGALTILSSITNKANSHSLDVGWVFNRTNSGAPLDLVCGERDAGEIEIHQGIGPGIFDQSISSLSVSGNRFPVAGGPRAVKLVDIDGDGWNDLVVVLENDNEVLTFGNRNGQLGPEFDRERAVGSSPREMTTADFDDDGFPDLAVINRDSQDASTLLAYPQQVGYRGYDHLYIADGDVAGLVVQDFNGDGRADVIQLHRASGDFSVRLADTNGLLGPPTFYTIGNLPVSQVVTFVNNDSDPDHPIPELVTVNLGTLGVERPSVSVRLGKGDGTFGPETRYELPANVEGRLFALVAADFNGDGNIDLAVGFLDSRIAFFKGGPGGTLTFTRVHPFVHSARALLAADFDHDGRIDLAGVGANGELWVVHNTNNLMEAIGFSVQTNAPPATNGFAARTLVAVTNQDGYLDLVAGSGDRAYLYRGGSSLSFSAPIAINGSSFPISAAVLADFDGNGTQDLVLAGRFSDVLSVFTLTNGQYELALTLEVPASKFIATGDLDGDGKPDLVGAGNNLLWTALSGSAPTSTAPLVVEGRRPGIPNLVINEILALNSSWPEDSDEGRLVQWVEVYNGSGGSFPLVGWKLRLIGQSTLGTNQMNDFTFPPTAFFPSGQHLLVYFSNSSPPRTVYHTSFLLPADGGTLCLINPAGAEVDRVVYPAQRQDVSYARFQDGLPAFVFNPFPSPRRANLTRGRAAPVVRFEGVDAAALETRQVVRVYVDVQDEVGLADLTMYYQRLDDPGSDPQQIQLFDDGEHGDGGASDGRFAGVIGTEAGLPSPSEFQFFFRAIDLSDNEFTLPEDPVFGAPGQPGNVYSVGVGFRAPPVELSEVVARNVTSLHDESGATPDWVEVRNVSTNSLPLDGVVLSHQIGDNSRYYFPTGTVLVPGQHFVVYCDGHPDRGARHAPFNLSSAGDQLMLSGFTGDGAQTLIDWVSFGPLETDQALARLGAGGNWRKTVPTPYACNIATSWVGFVETNGAAPVFTFAFPTTTNALYTVQYRAALNSSEGWVTLETVPGDGIEKVVPQSLASSGFFRVRKVPYP